MSSDDYEDFDETAADGADEEELVEEVEAVEGEKAPASGDGEGRTLLSWKKLNS